MTDNSLIHFGTKGMKWGVRKKKPQLSEEEVTQKQADRKKKLKKTAIDAGIATAIVLSSPVARGLISEGAKFAAGKFVGAQSVHFNRKYGSAPDNAISAGLEFAKKRFGAYNISSL